MKNKLKLIIFLLLCSVMILTAVSCKKQNNENTNTDTNTGGEITEPTDTNEDGDKEGDGNGENNGGTENNGDMPEELPNVRIMSYNILSPQFNSREPVAGREAGLIAVLDKYEPDVVGLQECHADWHAAIERDIVSKGKYKFACKYTPDGTTVTQITFLYNTETVKLVEQEVKWIATDVNYRGWSWAKFELLSDGAQFMVTNTHPTTNAPSLTSGRDEQLTRVAKWTGEKMNLNPSMPVFMTGDYNLREQLYAYRVFLGRLPIVDAKYDAKVMGHGCTTCFGYKVPANLESETGVLDHIFKGGNAKTLYYSCVIDCGVENTSDHIPIYADFKI